MNSKEKIYKDFVNDVYRYSLYKLKNKEEAEDVVSETFLRAYKSKDFQQKSDKKPWIIQIARNVIYEKYRELAKLSNEENQNDIVEEYKDESINLEESTIDETNLKLVKQELDNLDEITKEIIILKIWDNLKFPEISIINGLNESTVKLKYYRGLEKIKATLGNQNIKKGYLLSLGAIATAISMIAKDFLPTKVAAAGIYTEIIPGNNFRSNLFKNLLSPKALIATTAGKVVVVVTVTSAIVTTTAVGAIAYNHIAQSKSSEIQNTSTLPSSYPLPNNTNTSVKTNTNNPCNSTYSSQLYSPFTFQYDKCKWRVNESIFRSKYYNLGIDRPEEDTILLTNKSNPNIILTIKIDIINIVPTPACIIARYDYENLDGKNVIIQNNYPQSNYYSYNFYTQEYPKGTPQFDAATQLYPDYSTAVVCFMPESKPTNISNVPFKTQETGNGRDYYDAGFSIYAKVTKYEDLEKYGINDIIRSVNL